MRPLWKHQEAAIEVSKNIRDLALFYEQGTGKTRTTIEILRNKYHANRRLMNTLILCPVIVCENWKREFAAFSKINPDDIVVLSGSQSSRMARLRKELGDNVDRNKIIITNYEALQMENIVRVITYWKPEILICDESQRIKNYSSKRAKVLAPLADMTKHNYILTGTPITNGSMDIYMQFRILDRGETFGRNYFVFRNQYFIDQNASWKDKPTHFPKFVMNTEAYSQLQDKIKHKALRVLKSECLDLPPLVKQTIDVSLSAEQTKLYKQMKDDFIAFIDNSQKAGRKDTVTAQLAVTKGLRLQQIVSGYAALDDGTVKRLDCPRLNVLSELLEDITPENKVIVWCMFKENYKMVQELCTKLELGYAMITGDNIKTREDDMDRFRKDPKCRVMIANQSAGGVGITLVEASYSIYYSKGFSLEHDLQSEARNHRGGSEMHEKITRIDLVAKDTIDELINDALAGKLNVADTILTWSKGKI